MTTALLLALSLLQAEPAPGPEGQKPPAASATAEPSPSAPASTATAAVAEPSPSALAEPAPAATAEPSPAAVAEPSPSALAEPAPTATVEPTPAAVAEPPASVPMEPPPAATAEPNPAAVAEPPASAPLEPPPAAIVEPSPSAVVEPAPAAAVPDPTAAPEPPAPVELPPHAAPADEPAEEGGRREIPRWGLALDGGFPDAAGISVLWRPWRWLRLEAGGTTTVYASHGFRVGVSLVPFHFPLTPALTVNYGRALEADWNPMLERFSEPDPDLEPVLRKFGYQYVDAHLGLEIGAPRRFVLFVRVGLTQLWTTVHGLTPAAEAALEDGDASVSDTRVTMRVPSAKVGLLFYLF